MSAFDKRFDKLVIESGFVKICVSKFIIRFGLSLGHVVVLSWVPLSRIDKVEIAVCLLAWITAAVTKRFPSRVC